MKRFLFISLLYLISFSLMAQKVSIKVLQTKNSSRTEWQILDSQHKTIFSGVDFLHEDSFTFSLEASKKYFLKISAFEITNPDTVLYTLILNGEPILLIKSDIGIGDHLFPFFTGVRNLDTKITGGTNAVISDFPWQVYYISGNFRCGGSIISGNWIVTAAHCTQTDIGTPILASDMFVKVGANNPSIALDGKLYSVSEVIVNAGFDSQTLINDIALLRLKDSINYPNATPIKFITAADIAEGATVPGVMTWVSGWGLTHVNPDIIPINLHKIQLPIITNVQASTVWNSIPSTDIMAGFLNGNKDACNGDSGGPMVVPVLGEYKLAGIVSWGSPNCDTYGAYTRVSDFESWIQAKTGITYFKPPPPVGDFIICQGTESSQYSIGTYPGATAYEWKILPASAGVISGNSGNASVLWNISYTGSVNVIVRVTVNKKVSDWARLDGNVVPNTKLLSQSVDTAVCAGQPVSLNAVAEGHDLIFKWTKNGQVIQSGSSGKHSIQSTTINDSGDYGFEITGSCGAIISGVIKLTVYPLTRITFVSPAVEVAFGGDVTLEVKSDGHDLTYQWQKDGTLLDNSISSTLLLQNVNATNIGLYRTTVSGTCGIEISDSVYVYVKKANYSAEPEVFAWPTITSNEFTVALSTDIVYNVQIFNSSGLKIRELNNCQYQTIFNISTLAKGVYIIEIYNKDFRKAIRIIKE